jgi:hypothetical protein
VLLRVCFLSAAVLQAASIVVEGDPPVVRARGPEVTAASTLRVSVDQADAPALSGTLEQGSGVVTFVPRYRLQPGLAYRVALDGGAPIVVRLNARAARQATVVERMYPSAASIPENQLKFYLQFSAPMSRGEAFQRVHLIDLRTNVEVRLPFLEIDEELWDREQRRLTILFDPGRVKRGLVPSNEEGPPLVAGGRYRLLVDAGWKDAENRPLAAEFMRDFVVEPAWRAGIDVRQWKIRAPKAGTREALAVEFPHPLDAALLLRRLKVEGAEGEIRLGDEERSWRFVPDAPWQARMYVIRVMETLEDLAGNKIGRAFDVDVFEKIDRSVVTGSVKIPFRPF